MAHLLSCSGGLCSALGPALFDVPGLWVLFPVIFSDLAPSTQAPTTDGIPTGVDDWPCRDINIIVATWQCGGWASFKNSSKANHCGFRVRPEAVQEYRIALPPSSFAEASLRAQYFSLGGLNCSGVGIELTFEL